MSRRQRFAAAVIVTVMALATLGVLVLFAVLRTPPIAGAAEEADRARVVVVAIWAGAMVIGAGGLAALWRSRSMGS
jgi:protein-S-isoprenylcysteine O-methyltransferase Ste14